VNSVLDAAAQWLGTIIGLIGLVAATVFYIRSRRTHRLSYQRRDITLLGSEDSVFPDEVDIHFDGKSVPQVTSSMFVLWNRGNTTFRGTDIVERDPLRFRIEGTGSILKVRILRRTRSVNEASINNSAGGGDAGITFDFLDPRDGVLVEVLHSGNQSALELCGTLRGLPSGLENLGSIMTPMKRRLLTRAVGVAGWVAALLSVAVASVAIKTAEITAGESPGDVAFFHIVLAMTETMVGLLLVAVVLASVEAIRTYLRRSPSALQPDGDGVNDSDND
jgi:hypothetical protein